MTEQELAVVAREAFLAGSAFGMASGASVPFFAVEDAANNYVVALFSAPERAICVETRPHAAATPSPVVRFTELVPCEYLGNGLAAVGRKPASPSASGPSLLPCDHLTTYMDGDDVLRCRRCGLSIASLRGAKVTPTP